MLVRIAFFGEAVIAQLHHDVISLRGLDGFPVGFCGPDRLFRGLRAQEIPACHEAAAHGLGILLLAGLAHLRATVHLDLFLDVVRGQSKRIHDFTGIGFEVDIALWPCLFESAAHLLEAGIWYGWQKDVAMLAAAMLEILEDGDVLADHSLLLVPAPQLARHLPVGRLDGILRQVRVQRERHIPVPWLEVVQDEPTQALRPLPGIDLRLLLRGAESRSRSSPLSDTLLLRHHPLGVVLVFHDVSPMVGYPPSPDICHLCAPVLLVPLFCIFMRIHVGTLIPLSSGQRGIPPSKIRRLSCVRELRAI